MLDLKENTAIGIAHCFSITTPAMHGDSGTLNLIPVSFAIWDHDDGVSVLSEIVFPPLFELGR